jgi:hypothetical protein
MSPFRRDINLKMSVMLNASSPISVQFKRTTEKYSVGLRFRSFIRIIKVFIFTQIVALLSFQSDPMLCSTLSLITFFVKACGNGRIQLRLE